MTPAELGALLRQLYEDRGEGLRRDFDRSLSFADGLLDRWERARRLGFGEDVSDFIEFSVPRKSARSLS